jgi:hypothetical protein
MGADTATPAFSIGQGGDRATVIIAGLHEDSAAIANANLALVVSESPHAYP